MAATVQVRIAVGGSDGSPGSESGDLTGASYRFKTEDAIDPTDETNPIPIPAAGFNYSFWIHCYLYITVAPSVKINNIRHYTDGAIGFAYGSGGEIRRGNRDAGDKGAPMDTEYDVAGGTPGTTGYTIEDGANGHGYFNGQTTKTTDMELDVSGAPPVIDSGDHVATGFCKAVVSQVKLDTAGNGASQGEQTDEDFTWLFDEI